TQWEFTPTIVDGRAVPVIMTLNVSFKRPDAASAPPASSASAAPLAPSSMPVPPPQPVPPAPAPRPDPPRAAPARSAPADPDLESAFGQLQRRQYEDAVKAFRSVNDRRGQQCAVCWLGMARAFEALGAAKNVVDACDHVLAVGDADRALVVQAHQLKAIALQDMAQTNDLR